MIDTVHGPTDPALLIRCAGSDDGPDALVEWVEYRDFGDEIVHRSVTVTLKSGVAATGALGSLT